MADYTAQRELAIREQKFKKNKLKSDYDAYLAQLANQYGVSKDTLSSNLEARGILRSGEAGTAVTRLAAANQANRTNARSDYVYNRDATKIDLAKQLAALQSGTATPATTATQTTALAIPDPVVPVAPATDTTSDRRIPNELRQPSQSPVATARPKTLKTKSITFNPRVR